MEEWHEGCRREFHYYARMVEKKKETLRCVFFLMTGLNSLAPYRGVTPYPPRTFSCSIRYLSVF